MKKIMKGISLLLVMTMVLSLTACGEKKVEEPKGTDTNNTTDVSEPTKAAEKVEISMMHYLIEENANGETLAMLQGIDNFLASHPEVTLKQEALSIDNYEQKIKTLSAANEMPDVFLVKGSMVDTFIENGIIAPLNEALDARSEWKNGFKDGAFGDFTRGTDIYGAPYKLDTTSLVYYNEAIFKEVGITKFPETWAEFEVAIKTIKDAGYIPIALGNKGKWVAESCILSTLGDRFTGSEWFESVKNKEASFEDAEFIKALDALQGLATMGAFNEDMNSIDHNQQKTLFYNGEAAMFIEGAWAISSIELEAPKEISTATGIAIIPSVEGGKGVQKAVSGGAGWAFQINPNLTGARREAALDLIEMVTNKDYAKLAIEGNAYPATDPGEYDHSKLSPLKLKAEETLNGALYTPIYDIQLSPAVIEVMNSGLQELLSGIITPEELAAKIQKENK
jgi:raffinose/stachyose/melibiose transport system substrate-binding protein